MLLSLAPCALLPAPAVSWVAQTKTGQMGALKSHSWRRTSPVAPGFSSGGNGAGEMVAGLTRLWVKPPKSSPFYVEEPELLPSGYDPMMEYPGTMRPSKVRENSPFEDLPLTGVDEDGVTLDSKDVESGGMGVNVPWPHFQDIPWHITWGAPHEGEVPMLEFIDNLGRWLSPEEEEEISTPQKKSSQVKVKAEKVVVDDEEGDDDEYDEDMDVVDALVSKGQKKGVTDDTIKEVEDLMGGDDGMIDDEVLSGGDDLVGSGGVGDVAAAATGGDVFDDLEEDDGEDAVATGDEEDWEDEDDEDDEEDDLLDGDEDDLDEDMDEDEDDAEEGDLDDLLGF